MWRSKVGAWGAGACVAVACGSSAAAELHDARALVQRWIKAGAEVTSIEADFVQERRLKALRKPLIKPGRIWFQRPESFRWQIGEPPAIIAVRKSGGDLQVVDTREKKLRVWTAVELAEEAANGRGHGLGITGAGFPATMEAFENVFEIKLATETAEKGVWDLRLNLRDRKARLAVDDVVFTIVPADGTLRQFRVLMRDGSVTTTRMTSVKKNQPIQPQFFQIDTPGCAIEKQQP